MKPTAKRLVSLLLSVCLFCLFPLCPAFGDGTAPAPDPAVETAADAADPAVKAKAWDNRDRLQSWCQSASN